MIPQDEAFLSTLDAMSFEDIDSRDLDESADNDKKNRVIALPNGMGYCIGTSTWVENTQVPAK
jgi:hypothetical protein